MRYRSVRGPGRYLRRSRRQDALPVSITLVFCVTAALAFYYSRQPSAIPETDTKLLLQPSVRATTADYGTLCNSDKWYGSKFLLFGLIPGVIFLFVGLAIVTDEYFVASLERICERLDLTEDVAGATFMAAGSSTPEFFASMLGVFLTEDEVGVGTIVGSAVFNILVIIGLSAAMAGAVLQLDWRPLARDSFFYIISVILLLIFVLPSTKGRINWWEGLILVLFYVAYVLFMAFLNKPYMKLAANLFKRSQTPDLEAALEEPVEPKERDSKEGPSETIIVGHLPDVADLNIQHKPDYGKLTLRNRFRAASVAIIATHRLASSGSERSGNDSSRDNDESEPSRTFCGVQLPSSILGWIFFPMSFIWQIVLRYTIVDCANDKYAKYWWATFALSILWISGISYLMVEGARVAGCLIGIPSAALGLTVLAAGTSVPDALASISVARNGAADMAVSNAIGSNVFDILLGLGLPWFLGDLIKTAPISVETDPLSEIVVPICILFGIIVALIFVLILLRWKLRPLLGIILFCGYGVFVVYTLLNVYFFQS